MKKNGPAAGFPWNVMDDLPHSMKLDATDHATESSKASDWPSRPGLSKWRRVFDLHLYRPRFRRLRVEQRCEGPNRCSADEKSHAIFVAETC